MSKGGEYDEFRAPWQNSLRQGPITGGALPLPFLPPAWGRWKSRIEVGFGGRNPKGREHKPLEIHFLAQVGKRAGHLKNLIGISLGDFVCACVCVCTCVSCSFPFSFGIGFSFIFSPPSFTVEPLEDSWLIKAGATSGRGGQDFSLFSLMVFHSWPPGSHLPASLQQLWELGWGQY